MPQAVLDKNYTEQVVRATMPSYNHMDLQFVDGNEKENPT